MRFLMLNWRDPKNPLSGGAERVTHGYLSALRDRGHDISWFAYDFADAPREETIDGMQIHRAGGKGTAILEACRWYRRQPRFDLVIDQHHGIPWFAPWWCGTNCVAYIHEVLGPIWNSFYSWPLSAIGRSQERWTHWLYRNTQFWTACESTRDQLQRHGVKKIHIIRYGVGTVALPLLDAKVLPTRDLPLSLAVVSRLAPNKRIDHAIQVIAELRSLKIPSKLTIIGTGECEPALREKSAILNLTGDVHFTGALPEVQKDILLRKSHLLLHTSQREGWGLNVIEANAMGTPAVVYPVPGLIESTLDNETGLVSRAETPASLAQRISELTATQYQTLRAAAWHRAQTFHWSRVLPIACDWLEEMARKRKP